MKKYIVYIFVVFISIFLLSNFTGIIPQNTNTSAQINTPPKKHNLVIRRTKRHNKNMWRVVHSEDTTTAKIVVHRGETVVWHSKGTDAFFQFPDENLFGTTTAVLKKNNKLELTVGSNAKIGANPYSIFCTGDDSYAVGDSPPVIIVE